MIGSRRSFLNQGSCAVSDIYESRLDEMASKIAILEEEVAGLKKKIRGARRKAQKAAGAGGKKKKTKDAEAA